MKKHLIYYKYTFIFPIVLFTIGNLYAQNFPLDSLQYFEKNRNLIALHHLINDIDTTSLSSQKLTQYYYFKGSLALYEDNNEDATNYLIKARKNHSPQDSDDFLIEIDNLLLSAIGSSNAYIFRPQRIIDEICDIAETSKNPNHLYLCEFHKFSLAVNSDDYTTASSIIKKLYDYVYSNNLEDYKGAVNSNFAHIALYNGDKDIALKHFLIAEKEFQKANDTINLVYINNNLGNYYKRTADYETALHYLNKALKLPIRIEESSTKKIILRNIADVTYFKGDYKEAALNYEKYALISDSLDQVGQAAKIEYYNQKFESSQKEKQILEEQTKKKRNQYIAYGLGGTLLLTSIIAFLVYRNTKRKQHIAEQEKELEIQKTTALLKEQEITTINAMIEGQEKERLRIAGDLHDNLGGTLAAVKMHIGNLQNNISKSDNPHDLLDKANTLISEAYKNVRSIAHERNSGVMAKEGLLPAVQKLANKVSSPKGLSITVQDFGLEERLSNYLEITIFRIIQELITNIIKHAHATEATISLTQHEEELNIMIEDNGKGFKVGKLEEKDGMGLGSIERRVEHLEGTMEVDSTLGKGTNIIIDLPL